MRRYSILSLMGLVLVLGVGLAALRGANDYWAGALLSVTLLSLGTAVLGIVYGEGQARAGWLGFGLFGGAYMAMAIGPWLAESLGEKLPTTKFLSYAHARVDTVRHLRSKLVFRSVDRVTGVETIDEVAIRADPSQRWKALLPGAADYGPFRQVGHCLFALLAGLLGATIARRFERRRERGGESSPVAAA